MTKISLNKTYKKDAVLTLFKIKLNVFILFYIKYILVKN